VRPRLEGYEEDGKEQADRKEKATFKSWKTEEGYTFMGHSQDRRKSEDSSKEETMAAEKNQGLADMVK
jgi:hypothetical protein